MDVAKARTRETERQGVHLPHSYLYVIAEKDAWSVAPVKVGRSNSPAKRVSGLQGGVAFKLAVHGSWPVPAADVVRLERACLTVLRPFRVRGEIFKIGREAAASVVSWLAAGNEPDEFVRQLLIYERLSEDWLASEKDGGEAETEARHRLNAAFEAMIALDEVRARAACPMAAWARDSRADDGAYDG